MVWRDDWPVMGADPRGTGKGEPVLEHAMPAIGKRYPIAVPQTSDAFDSGTLGLQWQWNANPADGWAIPNARPGFLRLTSVRSPANRNDGTPAEENLYDAPNLLLQKFSGPAFEATTFLDFAPVGEGERAGLIVFGYDYAYVGLRATSTGRRLVHVVNLGANRRGAQEREAGGVEVKDSQVYLRVTVDSGSLCRFAYSFDNQTFTPIGRPFKASADRWIGAKVGLFSSATSSAPSTGYADFKGFRITPQYPDSSAH